MIQVQEHKWIKLTRKTRNLHWTLISHGDNLDDVITIEKIRNVEISGWCHIDYDGETMLITPLPAEGYIYFAIFAYRELIISDLRIPENDVQYYYRREALKKFAEERKIQENIKGDRTK